jgi:putative membrane protein
MPVKRHLLLACGLILLAWLWAGPLPDATSSRFSAHMLLHMSVVSIAAPILALGVAGGPLDVARRWPTLLHPLLASVVELCVVWGWHAPALHAAARHHAGAFAAEQMSFLIAGLWLWLSAFGGERSSAGHRAWTGVAALLFTSMHMTLLGALFALAPRPLYGSAAIHGGLSDLHLGGSLMLLIGGASYLAGGLWLSVQGLRANASYTRRAV